MTTHNLLLWSNSTFQLNVIGLVGWLMKLIILVISCAIYIIYMIDLAKISLISINMPWVIVNTLLNR